MIISNAKTPLRGQSLDKLDVIIYEDSIRSVHLTKITLLPGHTYFDTKGRTDIHFSYESYVELKNIKRVEPENIDDMIFIRSNKYGSSSRGRTDVRFLPTNTKGVYKIETMYFERGRHYGNTQPPGWSFKGYSNDTTFPAVKVYNYYLQHAPVYKVYKPKKLDEQPYFSVDSVKTDFKDYISEQIKRSPVIADNLCGTVTFSFVIHPFGWVVDFKVDRIKLKPKNEFIRINKDMDINFAQQIDIFFRDLNYKIVKFGFYTRSTNHCWTPGKIKGEAVASIQYLTFEFK